MSSNNGGSYAPLGTISSNDHGSYMVIVNWILLCISIIFVAVRVGLRTWTTRHFGLDNILVGVALTFAIAESIVSHVSVGQGLGKHVDSVSSEDVSSFYKTTFASQLLSVVVFVFTKLSLISVFSYITSNSKLGITLTTFAAFTVVWGLANLASTGFQCGVAVPFLSPHQKCVNQLALYLSNGSINIATDVFIVVLPAFVVWDVRITLKQKVLVCAMFWVRIAVPITAAIQLSTVGTYLNSNDRTWDGLYPALWNQVTVHLSVITACIPFLKPFFESMQSSLVVSGVPRNYSTKAMELRPWQSSSGRMSSNKSSRAQNSRHSVAAGLFSKTRTQVQVGAEGDRDSTTGLAENAIREQRDVDISVAIKGSGESQNDGDSQRWRL